MLAFLYAGSSNRLSNQLRTKTTSWGTSYKHMDTALSLPDFRNHRNHSWMGMVQLWTTPSRWKRVFFTVEQFWYLSKGNGTFLDEGAPNYQQPQFQGLQNMPIIENHTHNISYFIAKTGWTTTIQQELGTKGHLSRCNPLWHEGRNVQAASDLAAACFRSTDAAYEALREHSRMVCSATMK